MTLMKVIARSIIQFKFSWTCDEEEEKVGKGLSMCIKCHDRIQASWKASADNSILCNLKADHTLEIIFIAWFFAL